MGVSELSEYRWSHGGDSPNWTSAAVAIVATVLLFAAALAAMTRVRELRELAAAEHLELPRVVTLPPPPIVTPRAEVPPPPVRRVPMPIAAPAAPAAPAPPSAQPAVAQPNVAAPSVPPAVAARDSAAGARAGADAATAQARGLTELRPLPIGPVRSIPRTLGTPPEPAGVTIHNKKLTLEQMNAMDNAAVAGMAQYARTHPETPAEREANNRGPHPPPLQNGPAGDMRRGMTQIPAGSIPLPLFSPGLSPAQRKRNAVIDSEYQWRLRRLEDRAALVRDSVRADSVRADSVARVRRP